MNDLSLGIYGDEGAVEIKLTLGGDWNVLRLCRGKRIDESSWRTVRCRKTPSTYKRFIDAIRRGEGGQPDFVRGAEIQQLLDSCIEADRVGQRLTIDRQGET